MTESNEQYAAACQAGTSLPAHIDFGLTCIHCGRPVFRRPDGTIDLVYREYQITRFCDARTPDEFPYLPHEVAGHE